MKIHLEFLAMVYNLHQYLTSTFFNPLINFRCSLLFDIKNTPLNYHKQRGEASQLYFKSTQKDWGKLSLTPPSHFSLSSSAYQRHIHDQVLHNTLISVMVQHLPKAPAVRAHVVRQMHRYPVPIP